MASEARRSREAVNAGRPTTGCRRRWAVWESTCRRVGRAPTAPEPERWADGGSAAMLPEPRSAFHMSDRQDHDLGIFQAVDDVVGEMCDQHAAAFGVFVGGRSDLRL